MNTMRFYFILPALFASAAILNACNPWDCEKGTGAAVKQPVTVAAFNGIVVEGSIEVVLLKADVQQVEVEAQANLIPLITTEVKNGVWHIGTKKCYITDKAFTVTISVPSLDAITVQGSGNVKSADTFTVGELKIGVEGSGDLQLAVTADIIHASVQGSGNIDLKGTSGQLSASVQGSGDIGAIELKAVKVKAEVTGSGDISVQAGENLQADISGSGDITYRGHPAKLVKNIYGSGELKQAE